MSVKHCFIDLPTPSPRLKTITPFFDGPDNPDSKGSVRCGTCFQRFPPDIEYKLKLDHLKTHDSQWDYFMEKLEHKLNQEQNRSSIIHRDPREADDLVLSYGIIQGETKIVVRLPKSRIKRTRYHTNRWAAGEKCWNKKVAEEYQNNHIGSYQGNFDKPICEKSLRCGNYGMRFHDFVTFRHEPLNVCKVFDINTTAYKQLENKEKIKAYFITENPTNRNIEGPATSIDDQKIVYTCAKNLCIFPCLCKGCVVKEAECSKHRILHPFLFNPDEHFFTVRNGDNFNINGNTGNITYSNSMQKGYEMIYDVYKYAGIKRNCISCKNDIFHHQAFHFVYHAECKFCRESQHRIEGIATHDKFLKRFENRRFEEKISCHYCFKIFSSVQYKNIHVKNVHEEENYKKHNCEKCNLVFTNNTNLLYHTQTQHGPKQSLQCKHCEKKFFLKQSLDVHVKSVHNMKRVLCDICNESFTRQSNLNSHFKYVHDVRDNILDVDKGHEIEYFDCEDCSFRSRDQRNLRRHMTTKHKQTEIFNCTECDYTSNRMDNLTRHIRHAHSKSERNTYSCKECNFESRYKSNLLRHMKDIHQIY